MGIPVGGKVGFGADDARAEKSQRCRCGSNRSGRRRRAGRDTPSSVMTYPVVSRDEKGTSGPRKPTQPRYHPRQSRDRRLYSHPLEETLCLKKGGPVTSVAEGPMASGVQITPCLISPGTAAGRLSRPLSLTYSSITQWSGFLQLTPPPPCARGGRVTQANSSLCREVIPWESDNRTASRAAQYALGVAMFIKVLFRARKATRTAAVISVQCQRDTVLQNNRR